MYPFLSLVGQIYEDNGRSGLCVQEGPPTLNTMALQDAPFSMASLSSDIYAIQLDLVPPPQVIQTDKLYIAESPSDLDLDALSRRLVVIFPSLKLSILCVVFIIKLVKSRKITKVIKPGGSLTIQRS